jgi:hypothetical protein
MHVFTVTSLFQSEMHGVMIHGGMDGMVSKERNEQNYILFQGAPMRRALAYIYIYIYMYRGHGG